MHCSNQQHESKVIARADCFSFLQHLRPSNMFFNPANTASLMLIFCTIDTWSLHVLDGAISRCFVDHLVEKLCEVLKYHLCQKFDILAEKGKKSNNTKLQELKECQASSGSTFSARKTQRRWVALSNNYLKALSSAIGGRKRTSSNGSCTLTGFVRVCFCCFCWEDDGWMGA